MKIRKRKVKNASFAERLKKKAKQFTTFSLNYVFTFGKYIGKTLQFVIHNDCQYIDWLVCSGIIVLDERAAQYFHNPQKQYAYEKEHERERQREYERHCDFDDRTWAKSEEFMKDFFRRHEQTRNRNYTGSSGSTTIDANADRLHPAYRFDNLPERQRYGKILRLTGQVTREDIKSQYRKLALTFHPDKCGALDEVMQETARIMFLQVQKAYEYFMREYNL